MDIGNIDIAFAAYQYANKAQKNNAAEQQKKPALRIR